MKVIAKIILLTLIAAVAASPCFAQVTTVDNDITLNYELGKKAVGKNLMVVVYAPSKSSDDLAEIGASFKKTIVFAKQVKADEKGNYSEVFKINYDEAVSGMYTVSVSGEGISETEKFLYTNKLKAKEVIAQLNENASDISCMTEILKTGSYDLGVGDKYFSDALVAASAELMSAYLADNTLSETNASAVANKAVAIAALNAGEVINIIDDAAYFDLAKSPISDFYKEDYVIDSVGVDMTERISGEGFESFEEFDEALTEAFVLAVVKNPNGSDNTKSVMQHFADEIGINTNGTTAQYEAVSDKNFDSYKELKEAFNAAKGSETDSGRDSDGRPFGGNSGGGSSLNGGSGQVSSVTYLDTEEKDEHTAYPIIIFDDLDDVAWAEDAILYLAETQIINGKGNYKFAPNDEITREEFAKIILNAFGFETAVSEAPFADVEEGSWYEKYVKTAYSLGVVKGHSDMIFGVGEKITREDMAVMIDRAAKAAEIVIAAKEDASAFDDDSEISGYAKESVYLLKGAGIINGLEEGVFGPGQNATRAQAALMIYNVVSK